MITGAVWMRRAASASPPNCAQIWGLALLSPVRSAIIGISVYSLEEWQSIIDRLHAMPQNKSRNIRRMLSGFASEAEPDAQDALVLPLSLREYAGLAKDAVIIGASTHCEIWSRENWEALCNELDSDTIAAVMDELNF